MALDEAAERGKNPIDIHVGSRVRLRRMLVGMSQERLGESLNLTFQQIQKYEKGQNRIGSSRLFMLAQILSVPVQFFFDDMPDHLGAAPVEGETPAVMSFVGSSEGLRLNQAFSRLDDGETRKRIVDLVETLAAGGAG